MIEAGVRLPDRGFEIAGKIGLEGYARHHLIDNGLVGLLDMHGIEAKPHQRRCEECRSDQDLPANLQVRNPSEHDGGPS